ncbi:MAG: 3-phosphoserine/phosphohydroxythreonine transaminase [Christensenellales bacterium]|nr:3-phosphoserine/phosphohydroxythreonine transaminase [Christensenellales bacterium]
MNRVWNFAPGPSMLADEVLKQVQKDLLCYGSTGMSVMEMSHRSKMYLEIFDKAAADFRDVMGVPEGYKVLFLQGGATAMFAAVAMNLMRGGKADYIDSGNFAHNALVEAQKYGEVNIAGSSREEGYTRIPAYILSPDASYVHITTNNTIYGTRYDRLPDTGDVPLVADMSSNILSEVYDVSKFGVIYAGAQKNIGPAGVVILVVREDLLGHELPITPKVMSFKKMADADSMLNTPNCFGIYVAGLTFEWIKRQGGVAALEQVNIQKAKLLYDYLDESKLFHGTAEKAYRSRMNVTFVTGDKELDAAFVKEAAEQGLVNLKGHRIVGGMRASIYNAMPIEGVKKLVDFMKDFEAKRR